MTTLIDRIMNKIEIDYTGKWADDMIAIKKILEAELTAVKGVDELVNDYTLWMEAEQNILKNADHSARNFIQKTKGRIEIISQILKDLKQTAVASECKHECDKYVDADGVHCERCTELIEPTTDERLKDSQPKECEGCKEKTRIINDLQQKLCAEYGIR